MRMNLLGQSHKHKPLNKTAIESSTDASQASSAYQFDEFDLSGRRGAYILSDSESQSQCPERKTNESCSKQGNNKKKVPKKRNKSSGKKILNTTFYPDQKGINKFINGRSELKGNKQVKTKNLKLENAKNIVRMTKRLCDQ